LTELENPYLLDLLEQSGPIPSYEQFLNTLLPNVMQLLFKMLENKLKNAAAITIIIDLWVNKAQTDFIAIGAAITNKSFEREIIVLNMMRMTERHTAEHV